MGVSAVISGSLSLSNIFLKCKSPLLSSFADAPNGKDRKDLLKVIHYGIMALYNHDIENGDKELEGLGIESEDGC